MPCEIPEEIINAFAKEPVECLKSEDYIVIFDNEEEVLLADPNLEEIKKLDVRGVIITSKSKKYDFVVRFFAPKYAFSYLFTDDPLGLSGDWDMNDKAQKRFTYLKYRLS